MRADFVRALEEVKPAFGVSSDELQSRVRGGIVPYGGKLPQLLESANGLIRQLKGSERTSLLSVLFEGPAGAGKTALAASIALQSEFPFVKLISPESFVGISEAGKAMAIARVFDDAHKSPLSLVVLDDLERLLEYVTRLEQRERCPALSHSSPPHFPLQIRAHRPALLERRAADAPRLHQEGAAEGQARDPRDRGVGRHPAVGRAP